MESYAYSSSQTSQQEETNRNNRSKQTQPFHSSSLHSIRKPPSKPWKKPVAPPLPPAPTKVYKVEPINFREVVQKLTGAPEFALDDDDDDDLVSQKKYDERVTGNEMFQSRRLQSVAPPPLEVVNHSMSSNDFPAPLMLLSSQEEKKQTPLSAVYRNMMSEDIDSAKPGRNLSSAASAESFPGWSPLGLGLSPTSHAWCSFPLLSPGTLI